MKFKQSLTLILLVNVLQTQASQIASGQNPLDLVTQYDGRTGTVAAAAFHGAMGLGVATFNGQRQSWQQLIQGGFLNNALYTRFLLSEFYTARCAIGVSPFTNSALQQTITWPSNLSGGQDCGTMLPGGFDTSLVNSFFNSAKSYSSKLNAARLQFEQGGLYNVANSGVTIAPNPLKSFAGTIVIPTANFVSNVGAITVGSETFNEPVFFPHTSTSSTADPTSLPISLKATANTLCDLTINVFPSSQKFNYQSVPLRLKSIVGTIAGQHINMQIYNGAITPTGTTLNIQNFLNADPNNPWALVIQLDAPKSGSGSVTVHATIPALVRLNPIDFPPHTATSLQTLLDYPSTLYYSITNVLPGYRTTSARLLRGIANGYLTSWKYNPKYDDNILGSTSGASQMMRPYGTTRQDINPGWCYPTPKRTSFNNNNPNTMLYALYAYRKSLELSYIKQSALTHLSDIIANPNISTVPNYIGQPPRIPAGGTGYYPVVQVGSISTNSPKTSASAKPNFLHRALAHITRPFKQIKNLFSKRITL